MRNFLFLLTWAMVLGVRASDSTVRVRVYPFAFVSKETSLSAGFASLCFIPSRKDTLHFSNIQFTAQYSLKQQSNLELWYQFFLRNDRWRVFGFVDHNRFPALFYGTGQMPSNPEMYTGDFQRLRTTLLRRIRPHWMLGFRYWFEDFKTIQKSENGLLRNFPSRNRISAPGLVWQLDTRDHQFYPSRGIYSELSLISSRKTWGASADYHYAWLDVRLFTKWHRRLISASQVLLQAQNNMPDYNQLVAAGGAKILRGYYLGKFRDRTLFVFQQEFRFRISDRLKWVAFGACGAVRESLLDKPETLLAAGGSGLRWALDKKRQLHLRSDLAFSIHGDSGFYLMMEEAF